MDFFIDHVTYGKLCSSNISENKRQRFVVISTTSLGLYECIFLAVYEELFINIFSIDVLTFNRSFKLKLNEKSGKV